jgi:hypothetical protein
MGWRFRHSFKVIPGVKLNLSKSGLSCSIGGAPVTLNVGPRGVHGTASLPGSGISFRQRFAEVPGVAPTPESSVPLQSIHIDSLPAPTTNPPLPTIPKPLVVSSSALIEEVRSSSTELLTSESLKELKRVIQMACEEHEDISRHLESARNEKQRALHRYSSWDGGFLLKRILKEKFSHRKAELDIAEAKVQELQLQLHLTTIATHVEIEKEQAEPYFRMRDEFAALSECAAIWDIKSHQATDKFRERTTASMRVGRERVSFTLANCDLVQWEQKVPHLCNADSGDLFLYPGFILYRAAGEAFSVIDFHDIRLTAAQVQFQEMDDVPKDSTVIGQTWAKANKDGERDKRFVNNYQIPIVLYASLTLRSERGLWEEFQFSNPTRLERFLGALNSFVGSFRA